MLYCRTALFELFKKSQTIAQRVYKVFCGKVKDKLKTSTGAHELVDSAEAFQKTVIGKKSDAYSKESTCLASRLKISSVLFQL